ncbi:hypothetical protein C0992_012819 [Termitomyces sp. T32_za158]|nr:hypothetical protein C0992_012819 [Termitomyces sp. T32_za158]
MTLAEDQRKRAQSASPAKQRGVKQHNKKRIHLETPLPGSDMDESEGETYSPSPLKVPPPQNLSQMTISSGDAQDMDLDGDTTLTGTTASSSPTPAGREIELGNGNSPSQVGEDNDSAIGHTLEDDLRGIGDGLTASQPPLWDEGQYPTPLAGDYLQTSEKSKREERSTPKKCMR